MRFCDEHWQALRTAVEAQGLGEFLAPSGETVAAQMADQVNRAETTPANFEPLMAAMLAITSNAMQIIGSAGGPALYLMAGPGVPEDPVEGYPGFEGRTWPRCPLCYLNLAHEVSCKDARCVLDKQRGYDYFIQSAAADQKGEAQRLRLVK